MKLKNIPFVVFSLMAFVALSLSISSCNKDGIDEADITIYSQWEGNPSELHVEEESSIKVFSRVVFGFTEPTTMKLYAQLKKELFPTQAGLWFKLGEGPMKIEAADNKSGVIRFFDDGVEMTEERASYSIQGKTLIITTLKGETLKFRWVSGIKPIGDFNPDNFMP